MNVNLLMTGNELMIGDITDSNSSYIAQQLDPEGFSVRRKITVGDDLGLLVSSLHDLTRDADVLIVNGGLGPTVDDLTAQALADALGVGLVEHAEAMAHLEHWCDARRIRLNAANRKQAVLPRGCFLIPNRIGSAIGFGATLNGTLVICTPGVPRELFTMLHEEILPLLRERFALRDTLPLVRYQLFGLGESGLQQWINDKIPDWPASIDLGFRASSPTIELKLRPKSAAAAATLAPWQARIEQLISDYVVSRERQSLQQVLVQLLTEQGKTVVTAESCTGGLIASQITEVAGASRVYEAGFVTYSNRMKQQLLGVRAQTLETHGAVSEEVVREMLAGALARSGATLGVAVSGIAGPTGGTADKPAGTVWIAWGSTDGMRTACLSFPGERKWFQTMTAAVALDLLRRELLQLTSTPRYLVDRNARRGS